MKQPYNTTIYNTALYMRLSRDDELQGESGSIQTQRMMLRQYAAEHGLNVIDEYIDDGWSGTNFDRPDFQRMIDDIEDGKINCVVTKDLSRLGRNYILTGQYTEIYFPSKGVRYIAVNDNVDTINGENELAPFLNILNEMHARQTSKKVKAAMRTRFANGAHYGCISLERSRSTPRDNDKALSQSARLSSRSQTPCGRPGSSSRRASLMAAQTGSCGNAGPYGSSPNECRHDAQSTKSDFALDIINPSL